MCKLLDESYREVSRRFQQTGDLSGSLPSDLALARRLYVSVGPSAWLGPGREDARL